MSIINIFLDFKLHTLLDFFFNVGSKSFFFVFFSALVLMIYPNQTLFFQKISICHFRCSRLSAPCDVSLESSWGVDSKYIYFHESETYPFSYIESYHIDYFGEKIPKLTFACILPKIGYLCSSTLGSRPPKYCKNKFMNKHITYSRYTYSTLKHYTYSRYSKSYLERPNYGV